MSTIFKNILPIPESVVVGSGSYVIPANKYGFLQANTSTAFRAYQNNGQTPNTNNDSTNTNTAASNSASQWVKEGDSITVSNSFPSGSSGNIPSNQVSAVSNFSSARVLLNGVGFCSSYAAGSSTFFQQSGSSVSNAANISSTGEATWSVSLFPIPKNNLPSELIEGN